jgi:hypothetical protein
LVLKGSLREFILADIFNLLAQQKITGKLQLSTGEKEGVIVFKDGIVVGAVKGEEQLLIKVFNLLVGAYRYSHEEIQGLFASYENNINNLFSEIVHLNLVRKDILESFAASVVEDIASSFFLWIKGTYHFSSVPYVDDVAASCVSISVENVIMEAMRRVDEWHRMEKVIHDDTVFVPNERHDKGDRGDFDPLTQVDEFLYHRIDGISTVSTLFRTTSLTEYKVYETLNSLIAAKRITPLSTRISQSVVAALEKKELEEKKGMKPVTTMATVVIAAAIVIVTLFIGRFLLQGLIFGNLKLDTHLTKLEIPLSEAMQKVAVASLQYHALYGMNQPNTDQLLKVSLLLKTDVQPLLEMNSLKELPLTRKNYILYQRHTITDKK